MIVVFSLRELKNIINKNKHKKLQELGLTIWINYTKSIFFLNICNGISTKVVKS